MTCARLEDMLLLHAHGQLGGVGGQWMEAHLHNCPGCRGRWARWVVERDALRRCLSFDDGPDHRSSRLMASVASRIRMESPRFEGYVPVRRRWGWIRELVPLAGLAAVILSVSVLVSAMAAFWAVPSPAELGTVTATVPANDEHVHACPLCQAPHRPVAH